MENALLFHAPYLSTLFSILLFTHIIFVALKFSDNLELNNNDLILNFITLYVMIIIILSYFTYFVSLIFINKKIIFISYLSFFLISIIFQYQKNIKIFSKFKFELEKKLLITLIVLSLFFFLLSLIPPSDADSLDYHLGGPLNILNNNKFLPRDDWLHYQLLGTGDFLNLLALSLNSINFAQLNNFFTSILIILTLFHFCKINNIIKNQYFIIFVFATPLVLWFVTSSKPQFFQSFIIFFSLYLFLSCKINSKLIFIVLTFLSYCLTTKISFLISCLYVFLIFSYFIYRKNLFIKFLKISAVVLSIFVIPFYVTNFIFYGDPVPPLFESFKSHPEEIKLFFLESIKKDTATFFERKSYSFYATPILISFPSTLSNFTVYIGPTYFFGFMISIFLIYKALKKKDFLTYKFDLIIVFFILTEYFFLISVPNLQPRYFLPSYFFTFLLVIKNLNFNLLRQIYILINSILLIVVFGSCLLAISKYIPASFFKDRTYSYYTFAAQNFEELEWIKSKIYQLQPNLKKNEYVLLSQSTRSHFLIDSKFIARQKFFSLTRKSELDDFIKKNNINFFVFEIPYSQEFYNSFVEKCYSQEFGKHFEEFTIARRNPLNVDKRPKYKIMLIKNICK